MEPMYLLLPPLRLELPVLLMDVREVGRPSLECLEPCFALSLESCQNKGTECCAVR